MKHALVSRRVDDLGAQIILRAYKRLPEFGPLRDEFEQLDAAGPVPRKEAPDRGFRESGLPSEFRTSLVEGRIPVGPEQR